MSITSIAFIGFTLFTLVVYYGLPHRHQNYWLLAVSYAFCISWAWEFAVVMLTLTAINFIIARHLPNRRLLWLGLLLNVVALIVFRDARFFVPQLLSLFGLEAASALDLLIPLGLSYYTLQNIAYLLDVQRQQIEPTAKFVNFALYIAYFPKLLAGPIERANAFLPQLDQLRVVDNTVLAQSLTLIVIGCFRKLIIADTLAAFIPWDVFTKPSNFGAAELWGWLFVYSFHLYNDFAGYTSIVRGVSGLFGIRLSSNFGRPYFARSFSEFWNRWHITLSLWLRDYVYFPTLRAFLRRNTNRYAFANIVIPPMLTMLMSGLWHGLSWNMVLWGALHGVYLIVERLLILRGPVIASQRQSRWRQVVATSVIFIFVSLAWVAFRAEPEVAFSFWYTLIQWNNWTINYARIFVAILLLLPIAVGIDWLQNQEELVFLRWPLLLQSALLAVALFLILILSQDAMIDVFVYQGF